MLLSPHLGLQVVSIDSLKAALVKMDIKVPVEDLISVIRELEEAKYAELIAQASQAAEHLPALPEFDVRPPEPSRFVQHSPRPENAADPPMPIEHRRRLLELFVQSFPDGVPEPLAHKSWTVRKKTSSV